jgi:repressor LexA
MENISDISDRILKVINTLGISRNSFAKSLGYERSQIIYDMINNKSAPSYEFFKKFSLSEFYEIINVDWLITGRGDMYRRVEVPGALNISDKKGGIPLINMEVATGFGMPEFAITDKDILGLYIVPDFNEIDFMIRVKDNGMVPTYDKSDVLACRIIRGSKFIQWSRSYLIATKEQGLFIKRIKRGTSDKYILAVSDNKNYEPFEIPMDEITGIALVVGVIRLE